MAVKTNDKEEKEIRVNRRIVCKFGGDLFFSFFFFFRVHPIIHSIPWRVKVVRDKQCHK